MCAGVQHEQRQHQACQGARSSHAKTRNRKEHNDTVACVGESVPRIHTGQSRPAHPNHQQKQERNTDGRLLHVVHPAICLASVSRTYGTPRSSCLRKTRVSQSGMARFALLRKVERSFTVNSSLSGTQVIAGQDLPLPTAVPHDEQVVAGLIVQRRRERSPRCKSACAAGNSSECPVAEWLRGRSAG